MICNGDEGNEVAEDIQQLKSDKVLVIISTPGRMKDIMDRQGEKLVVRNLEVLILDEADVLLVFFTLINSFIGFRSCSYY